MKRFLVERGLDHIRVSSAGTGALPDYQPPRPIVDMARAHDLDVKDHRSTPLDGSLLDWADMVLIMEAYMRDDISKTWSEKNLDKISLLGAYALEKTVTGEIPDPFGGSQNDFEACFDEIEASIRGLGATLL
jgi:protein-tyrosine-phosphatase